MGVAASQEPDRPWISGIVLAAGRGERLGGETPKPLIHVRGERLVHRACRALLEAGVEQVLVVVGYRGGEVSHALRDLPVTSVLNAGWAEGIGTSVAAGVTHIDPVTDAVLLVPADQPRLTGDHLRLLIDLYREKRPGVVATCTPDGAVRGAPALFDRRHFASLQVLEGDAGAKQLLESSDSRVTVALDADALLDVDTPEDLADAQA